MQETKNKVKYKRVNTKWSSLFVINMIYYYKKQEKVKYQSVTKTLNSFSYFIINMKYCKRTKTK